MVRTYETTGEHSRRMFKKTVQQGRSAAVTKGVGGMISTARVQRGPSEAARCASNGIVPATP